MISGNPRLEVPPARRYQPWTIPVGLSLALSLSLLVALKMHQNRRQAALSQEMLSLVAHELKSPLSAIESYLDLMMHEGTDKDSSRKIQRWLEDAKKIKNNARQLRQTVSDLLQMADIGSGKIRLNLEPVDFPALVSEVCEAFRPYAEKSGITMRFASSASLPEVIADPLKIRQVFNNLLANAIKFTPSGGRIDVCVKVEGGGERETDNIRGVLCLVKDTGVGIAPADQNKLFKKFGRLHPADPGREGVGLGLFISKAIIEAHGGRIWLESEKGRGAAFYFSIPVEKLPVSFAPVRPEALSA